MKRSEYARKATVFRSRLMAEASKSRNDQVWPELDEWLSVQGTATCTTPTCVVQGQSFPVTLHENADGVFRGICGRCGQATTVVATLEDD